MRQCSLNGECGRRKWKWKWGCAAQLRPDGYGLCCLLCLGLPLADCMKAPSSVGLAHQCTPYYSLLLSLLQPDYLYRNENTNKNDTSHSASSNCSFVLQENHTVHTPPDSCKKTATLKGASATDSAPACLVNILGRFASTHTPPPGVDGTKASPIAAYLGTHRPSNCVQRIQPCSTAACSPWAV